MRSAGRNPRARVMGLLIAATARAHDLPFYARIRRDFAGLERFIEIHAI